MNPAQPKVFHPDILFVSRERAGIITRRSVQGAPDLVVEVLSQRTQKYDLTTKKAAYEAAGVREYWAIWQDWPRIEIYKAQESGRFAPPAMLAEADNLTSDLLPGFSLTTAELYAGLPDDNQEDES